MPERDRSPGFDDTVAFRDAHGIADFEPGSIFAERYRIEERLGAGGMGVVYRVHDLRLDEPVALKIMAFAATEAAQRFVEEVRLARRVTHPHVARTHDLGEHQGLVYLTMEFIAGDTLEGRIDREGALAPEIAAGFGVQLASALEAAHEAGVIHRDLKPSNVLVTAEGRAVITDFGIARAAQRDSAKRTAGIIGTPAYMSPEQAAGAAIDARSDIYSLGIILYEMLTARLPFEEEEEPLAIALARLRRAPTHLSEHQPVPQPLSELTMWMLAREPDARPQSAKVVRESLQAFQSGTTGPTTRSATAAVSPGNRAIAVLPFRYRGDPEHDYLGEGLAEELIDTLSRTRGLRVLALGATARFSDNRDPTQVSSALDADAVVDGTVQFASGRLRIVARLHDGRQGVQLWNDRFDVPVEDLFAVQESIGKRLAEALRLELHAHMEGSLPSEAVALYMRARQIYRQGTIGGSQEMLEMLERCLELAPDFAPAYAAHAMGAVRAWWLESTGDTGSRRERAEQSIARAVERAGGEPETQLARASFAVNVGDYHVAARALARALDIAPTMAEAQQHLANLEVEAGRMRQGMARLKLSLELDPKLNASRMTLARLLSYQGKFEEAAENLQAFADAAGEHHPGLLVTRVRIAMLQRDTAALAPTIDTIEQTRGPLAGFANFFRLVLGKVDLAEAEAIRQRANVSFRNPRFLMAMTQVCVEVFACAQHYDAALRALGELAGGILIDVVWLDHCPLLEPLRSYPVYAEAAAKVRHRAAAIWLP